MDENRTSPFGGTMGRVLRDANSFSTLLTGVMIGLAVLTTSIVLGFVHASGLAALVGQVVIAVALARFALNGLVGESRGTLFSTAGGSWPMAVAVAGRYLALNLLWAIPLIATDKWILDSASDTVTSGAGIDTAPAVALGGPFMPAMLLAMMSKTFLLTTSLFLFCTAVLPPVILIVAVRSERFAEIVSPALWRACFAGRLGDLYLIYAVHGGAMCTLLIVAIPALVLGFAASPAIGWLFLAVGMTFGGGLMVTLLGRLCGFFAFGEEQESSPVRRSPLPERHAAAMQHAAIRQAETQHAVPSDPVSAGAPPGEAEPGALDPSGKPPLIDPAGRVAAARQRFEQDRDGALGELRDMEQQHAPSPQVRHAMTICLHQTGRAGEALVAARAAIPLCLERGNVALAAEIFALLWRQAKQLGLNRDQIDAVATTLAKSGDSAHAITAFGMALSMDHGDRRAIKGLLQLADRRQHDGHPKDAVRIYTFLLQYAADTPFAEDMRRGLADAEMRLRRAS
jgi:hypothetical protein